MSDYLVKKLKAIRAAGTMQVDSSRKLGWMRVLNEGEASKIFLKNSVLTLNSLDDSSFLTPVSIHYSYCSSSSKKVGYMQPETSDRPKVLYKPLLRKDALVSTGS